MARPSQIASLDLNEPLKVSLRRTLLEWTEEMLSYESETIKGTDPEALHNMRVSARRLRAILKIHREFFPKKLFRRQVQEIEKLIDTFGPIREIDVCQEELKRLIKELPTNDRIALQWLLAQQQTIRETHRRTMKAEIRKIMRSGFKQRFEDFVWRSLR